MHHSIWTILFVSGADEYLERLEGKIRKWIFFFVKYSKITVWNPFIGFFVYFDLNRNYYSIEKMKEKIIESEIKIGRWHVINKIKANALLF